MFTYYCVYKNVKKSIKLTAATYSLTLIPTFSIKSVNMLWHYQMGKLADSLSALAYMILNVIKRNFTTNQQNNAH